MHKIANMPSLHNPLAITPRVSSLYPGGILLGILHGAGGEGCRSILQTIT